MLALLREPLAIGQVFNVGSDREVTINDLARDVRRAAGSNSPIVHIPYDEAYAEGFEPSTTLEEIITDVIAEQRAASLA